MRKEMTNRRRKKQKRQPYWVVIWDKAADLPREQMVDADSSEQAEDEAIKAANRENGNGPEDDGGFIPGVVYDRSDLLRILESMDAQSSPP